jgi:hypothetical protein
MQLSTSYMYPEAKPLEARQHSCSLLSSGAEPHSKASAGAVMTNIMGHENQQETTRYSDAVTSIHVGN